MDWTQVMMALIVGLPAIIAAVGSFINTLGIRKLQAHVEADKPLVEQCQQSTAVIKDQNAHQTVVLNDIAQKTGSIARAVNGDLDARFRKVESKIDSLVEAMLAAKLIPHHPNDPGRPPSEMG